MLNFKQRRINNEERNLEENADSIPPNCKFQRTDKTHYVLQYTGLQGTPHEGAYIIVDLDISNYPEGAPVAMFRNNFEHVNVFPAGKLCLYQINPETFTSGTSLLEIFIGIGEVIHNPTFSDPANSSLIIADQGRGYNEKMRIQAQRLKDPRYKIM